MRRRPNSSGLLPLVIVAATAVSLLATGCADRERIEIPKDAEGLTARGWEFFTENDLEEAEKDFEKAIEIDAGFAPAYLGLAWSRLGLASSSAEMAAAAATFGTVPASEAGPAVDGGRAAAELGAGGAANLDAAISFAQSARTGGSFQFEHRTSFDSTDLFLIEAFARAAKGEFAAALSVADAAPVADSGIVAGTPGTWQVSGTTYPTFESAVLAFLQKLSEEHAG